MAADPIAEAFVRIRPDASGFRGDAERDVKHAFGGMAGAASGAFRGIALGAAAAGVAVGGFGALALNAAGNFEQSLNVFQAVTKSTGAEMEKISGLAKKLGADITLPATSAKDAADAMTELAKGGLSVKDTMSAAKGVLQLSAAATIDNARAAQITARALNAFGLAGTKAGMVADVLANAANASTGEIEDFALGLQQSSAIAKSYGLSINETTAALMELANAGVVGSDAGTSLKTMLMALTPTTNKQKDAFKAMGVDTFDAAGKFVGITSVIEQFHSALGTLTEEQQKQRLETIFGSDATRAANIILGQGAEEFLKYVKATERSGSAADLAASKMKGFKGAIEGLKSAFQTLMISIGEPILNVASKAVRALSGVVNMIDKIVAAPTMKLKLEMAKTSASEFLFGKTKLVKTVDASARIMFREVKVEGLVDKIRGAVAGVDWQRLLFGGVVKAEMPPDAFMRAVGPIETSGLTDLLKRAIEKVNWATVWAGATGIADGLAAKFKTVNWTGVGATIGEGIRDSIVNAAKGLEDMADAFTGVLRSIGWEDLGKSIGPGLAAAMVSAFVTLLDPVFWIRNWELMVGVALAIFPVGKIASGVGKLFKFAFSKLGIGPLLSKALGAGLDGIGAVAQKLGPMLGGLLLRGVRAAIAAPVAVFNSLGKRIAEKLGKLGTFIAKALSFAAILSTISDFAGSLVEALTDPFNTVLEWLGTRWRQVVTIISGPFSGIVGLATNAFGLKTALTGAFSAVLDWLRSTWKTVATIISGPFLPIINLATTAFGLLPAITSAFGAIKGAVATAIGAVRGVLVGSFTSYVALITGYLNAIRAVFTAAWNAVKAVVTGAVGVIRGVITSVVGGYVALVTGYLTAIRTVFTTVWGALSGIVGGALGVVRGAITGALSTIGAAWSAAWGALKGVVTTAFSAATTAVTTAAGAIVGAARTLGSKIVSGVVDALLGLAGGVAKKVGQIASVITGLAGSVFKWALDLGKQIVQGILDGLIGLPEKLARKIGGGIKKGLEWGWSKVGSTGYEVARDLMGKGIAQGTIDGFTQGIEPLGSTIGDAFSRALANARPRLDAAVAGIPDVFMRAVQAAGRTVQSSTAVLRAQLEKALGGAFRSASQVAINELIGGLKKLPGALRTSVLDAIGGQTAAAWTGAMHGLNQAGQAIVAAATKYGVDARAALAVAMGEGGVKFGAVGDKGTSFGPFQMHLGGALPAGMDPKKAAAFANSIMGIEAAVRAMAAAGAKGKVGMAAIQAIVRGFEKPADPSGSIAKAAAAYKKLAGGLQAIPGVARAAGTALERLTAFAKEQGVKITSSTGGKHAPGSKHYQALAIDIAGSAGKMREFFMAAMKKFGPDIDELFFDPIGFYLDNGVRKKGAIGDHGDHVHLALKKVGAGVISGAAAIQDGADFAKDAIGGAAEIIKRALAQLANISEFQASVKQAAREAAVAAGLIPAAVVSQGAFNAAIGNAEKLMRRLATVLVGEQEMERIKAGLDRAKQTISARLTALGDTVNAARTKFTEVWQTFRDNVTRAFSETVVARFRLNVEFGDLTLTLERAKIDAQHGWDAFAAAVGNAGPAEAALIASFNRTAQAQQAYFTALASGNRAIIEASAREYAAAQSELARSSEGAAGDVAQAIIRGGQAALAAEDTLGRDRIAKAQRRWEDLATAEQENVGNYIDRVQQRLLSGKVTFGAAMAQITEFLRARGLDLSQVGEVMGTAFQTQLNQSLRALPLAFAGMETAIGRLERAITFLLRGLPGGAALLRQLGVAHRQAARDADAHAASTDKVGGAIGRGATVVAAARIPFGAAGKTVGEAAAGGIISGFGEKITADSAIFSAAAGTLGVKAGEGIAGGVAGGLAGMQAAIAAGLGEGIVHIDKHGVAYDEAGGRLGQKITAGFARATAQIPATVDAAAAAALATPIVDAVAPAVAEQETYAARTVLLSTFVTDSTEALRVFYEKTANALRAHLQEIVREWKLGQEAILTMLGSYLEQYRSSGKALTDAFADGMRRNAGAVASAAEFIAQVAARYFPRSPAKEGPLRDLGRMGEEISTQLAAGIVRNLGAITAASAAAAQAAAPRFARLAPAATPVVPNTAGAAASAAGASAIPLRALHQTEQQALEQLRIGNELLARLLAKAQDVVVNVGVADPNEIARSVRR